MAKFEVGAEIDSWCTKCKLMLVHTIETVVGDKVTKVHCNTCKGQHAYRRNPPGTATARSRAGKKPSAKPAADYETLLRGRTATAARPYSIAEQFKAGQLISHPVFGLGVVTLDKGENKVEVVFPEETKTLVHGR